MYTDIISYITGKGYDTDYYRGFVEQVNKID